MDKRAYNFDQRDLSKIDEQLKIIKKACSTLGTVSNEKGGIPAIGANIRRIDAAVDILMTISEVLEILEEEEQERG